MLKVWFLSHLLLAKIDVELQVSLVTGTTPHTALYHTIHTIPI